MIQIQRVLCRTAVLWRSLQQQHRLWISTSSVFVGLRACLRSKQLKPAFSCSKVDVNSNKLILQPVFLFPSFLGLQDALDEGSLPTTAIHVTCSRNHGPRGDPFLERPICSASPFAEAPSGSRTGQHHLLLAPCSQVNVLP